MKNAAIRVIKKRQDTLRASNDQEKTATGFSRKVIHNIEGNIKNWIEELHVKKDDELIQTYMFLNEAS